jgi:hypothetical protein
VGGAQAVFAGGFEGAIEIAHEPAVGVHDLPAQRAPGVRHGADLFGARLLRPRERVEHRVRGAMESAHGVLRRRLE